MIIALLFLILFAILFPGALRFLFGLLIVSVMVIGASHDATSENTTDQLIASYPQAKARCIKYGNGSPIDYDAGDRGERDCENLGYIIKTLTADGCHYKKDHWICIK
jgi:hypothetical protein